MSRPIFRLAALALLLVFPLSLRAEEKQAAHLLPPSTVLYVEASQPNKLLDMLLEHPLRRRLEQTEPYREAVESPKYAEFQLVLSVIEANLGMTWREAVEGIAQGGVYVAADSETDGVALLVRARDEETLKKIGAALMQLARQDARRKGKDDPIKTGEYREQKAHQIDKGLFTALGPWLVVVNKPDLGKKIIDQYLDGGPSLAAQPMFQTARKEITGQPTAWVWLDMQAVRDSGKAEKLVNGRTDNPVAEIIAGGLIDNFQHTPYLTLSAYVETSETRLAMSSPHQDEWVGEARRHFFGAEGHGAAPPMLEAPGVLLSVSAYRNISEMWLRADDLFDERTNDQLAKADTVLSTLFSGRDFGQDIAGAIHPELQVVVARQDFSDQLPRPSLKLPAAAVVGRMKDPERMQGELRRTFLSVVGFFNVVGAMNGQPQLDFDIEKEGDAQIIAARFLPSPEEKESTDARINFNFSPSMAFVGDMVILASTEQLARDLMKHAAGLDAEAVKQSRVNSAVVFDFSVLHDMLDDNRDHLVAENMLKEGHTHEEAESHIDAVLAILDLFQQAKVKLSVEDERLVVETVVRLKPQDVKQ